MFPVNPLGSVNLLNLVQNNTINGSCPEPNNYVWVYNVFHECIYNPKEEVGFILGLISILCWVFAALPQLYENYKNGKVDESLSIWFILFWLFGDTCNLVGCILTQQFPIQLYTAIYYVAMDIIMLLQFLYYKLKHRKQACRGVINEVLSSTPRRGDRILCCLCLGIFLPLTLIRFNTNSVNPYPSEHRVGRALLQLKLPTPSHSFIWTTKTTIGYVVGCFSSVFYLGSRLPQIIKNYHRGQTEGVSAVMFFLAISGNTLYGASILLQDPEPGNTWGQFILFHLPWLIGSIGTLSLDVAILSQIGYYSNYCRRCRNNQALILVNDEDEDSYAGEDPLVI